MWPPHKARIGVLCGDQLGKRHEEMWRDHIEVMAIVCVRDESGIDGKEGINHAGCTWGIFKRGVHKT